MHALIMFTIAFVGLAAFAGLVTIPALVARSKHRYFEDWVWVVLAMPILLLPAIIAAIAAEDRKPETLATKAWGDDWRSVLALQRSSPSITGWYVHKSYDSTLQWWSGERWTNAWLRVDGHSLVRVAGEQAWSTLDSPIRESWRQLAAEIS
jgi:hypothetical protein